VGGKKRLHSAREVFRNVSYRRNPGEGVSGATEELLMESKRKKHFLPYPTRQKRYRLPRPLKKGIKFMGCIGGGNITRTSCPLGGVGEGAQRSGKKEGEERRRVHY